MTSLLNSLDWAVIISYFLAVFGVAIWATMRERTSAGTTQDYFLAGRNAGWFLVGGSLFASNIGSEHLVGLAGTGAASGVAVAQFEILASLILLLLGWLFVPFYLASGVFTMPEFLERRYSSGARWYLAVISIIGYVLTKISVTIAAGGIVFEALMGIDFWTGALIVVVATGIYTIFGGLRAVLYTDLMQMFVLIGGAIAVTWIGLSELGDLIDPAQDSLVSRGRTLVDFAAGRRSVGGHGLPFPLARPVCGIAKPAIERIDGVSWSSYLSVDRRFVEAIFRWCSTYAERPHGAV